MEKPVLSAQQIRDVIEGKKRSDRIPMLFNFFIKTPSIFGENEPKAVELMEEYPYDIQVIQTKMPGVTKAPADDPDFMWLLNKEYKDHTGGIDSRVLVQDWEEDIDEIIAHFPSADYHGIFPENVEETGKYRVVRWWSCLFERVWMWRGMENLLMDFYLYPDEIHRVFQKLTDFYMRIIERAHEEYHADAVFTSDDIGTQKSQFFSEAIFLEFFKPYYKQLIDKAHSLGMHFWLHTCGNVEPFIPHLIEIGLDVLHPIQKYTMDEATIAGKFGDKICIMAGFDVQRTIPYGTAEDVRREVHFMIDTYARPDGRLMLTTGNGLTEDCKITSFEALLDESYLYGKEKMSTF